MNYQELHLKYRPTTLDGVVGQAVAIAKLKKQVETGIPHTCLLSGPSGTGKTTIARILSRHLGVSPNETNSNFTEMNCADCRGIETVREIDAARRFAPMGKSDARVWILDEVVQLPTLTQQAFLKMLEDTKKHVYFFLCTTDTSTLAKTFISRCHPIELVAVSDKDMGAHLKTVAKKEGRMLFDKVREKIVDLAGGSVRAALVLLESAFTSETEQDQLRAVQGSVHESQAIELMRAVFRRANCAELMQIAAQLPASQIETLRWQMLAYANAVMLKNPRYESRAYCNRVISMFRDSWQDCGMSGLLSAIFEITQGK